MTHDDLTDWLITLTHTINNNPWPWVIAMSAIAAATLLYVAIRAHKN